MSFKLKCSNCGHVVEIGGGSQPQPITPATQYTEGMEVPKEYWDRRKAIGKDNIWKEHPDLIVQKQGEKYVFVKKQKSASGMVQNTFNPDEVDFE